MSHLATTNKLFFENTGLSAGDAERIVGNALHGADDGELFLEYRASESLAFDDGKLKNATYDLTTGFGLRAVAGETVGYAHAGEVSAPALERAAKTVGAVLHGYSGTVSGAPAATNRLLYSDSNPLDEISFTEKVRVLERIDAYTRGKDPRVTQVAASIANEWQAIQVLRADGYRIADIRPMVRVNVSVTVKQDGKVETGSHGCGGRVLLAPYIDDSAWQQQADTALQLSLIHI